MRELHATVLRRIESFGAHASDLPPLPVGDALEDATVLIAGRGPLYPQLSVAMGEQVKMLGALSVETAAKHLNARDIDGIVIGDGFSPRMVQAFLTVLAQDVRFRNLPIAVIGESPPEFATVLTNIDHIDLERAIAEAAERSTAISLARFSFAGPLDVRASKDGARLLIRLIRNIDLASRDDDGSIFIAFTQTDLRAAHVVARRIAGLIKNTILIPRHGGDKVTANVTLATLKADDTLQSLLLRVIGGAAVAAE